jgi:serine transporter
MGRNFIIKLMSLIVIPFIVSLLVLSLWMIQYWDFSVISQNLFHSPTVKGVVISIFVTIPIIIFSFNHSPIISSLGIYAKEEYGDKADEKASKIISLASMMMIAVVSLFILSTLFSLTSQDLMNAKEQNISILTYLANHSNNPYLQYMGPLIAIVAMSKSFFGHYLGSKEGIDSLVSKFCVTTSKKTSGYISLFIVFILCVIVSYFNPNILDVISNLIGPFLIIMLFFIPIYSIYKFKNLSQYKNKYVDSLIVLIGLLTIIIVIYQAIQSIL